MKDKHYQNIFEEFKVYFSFLSDSVISWAPKGENTIIIDLKDGTQVIYNHKLNTIRNVLQYRRGNEDDWKREFSSRLIEKMADRGFDQSYLSEISGISQTNISNYIKKKNIPSVIAIEKIAYALQCPIEYFIKF